jgi:hypothetical protein
MDWIFIFFSLNDFNELTFIFFTPCVGEAERRDPGRVAPFFTRRVCTFAFLVAICVLP